MNCMIELSAQALKLKDQKVSNVNFERIYTQVKCTRLNLIGYRSVIRHS